MKNLLLLGDSARMGYDSFVREQLSGRMNVFFPEDNGRFLQYTLRALSDWKAELSLPPIDMVHWNNGLWDVLHLSTASKGADGEAAGKTVVQGALPCSVEYDEDALTPPDIYRYMLGRVLTRIRQLFPGAEVIFATSTPVQTEKSLWGMRSNREIALYNEIAREVLIPRGVRINELGAFAAENCSSFYRDWVHYTDEGYCCLAGEIVRFLEKEGLI